MAAVSVVEDADGVARLRINNRQQEGSSATFRVDARQAWLPLLLHPGAARARCSWASAPASRPASAAEDPTLQVDAVELLPEVIAASAHFTRRVADGAADPRLHVIAADARRYVRASEQRYDVIVSDNFHPARSGSGALYTVEHFEAVRRRLEPGGLFCQWLPLHQLDLETLRSIVRSFLAAYPRRLGDAREQQPGDAGARSGRRAATTSRFDAAAIRDRLARAALPERAGRPRARRRARGARQLRRGAGGAAALRRRTPPPTPTIVRWWRTARRASPTRPIRSPRDRLLALLRELSHRSPAELIRPRRPIRPGRGAWPPTGRRATASSSRAATCGPRRACRRCWRRCASRCSPCCASVRTFVPPTIRCCRWRRRSRARTPPARARCSPS